MIIKYVLMVKESDKSTYMFAGSTFDSKQANITKKELESVYHKVIIEEIEVREALQWKEAKEEKR